MGSGEGDAIRIPHVSLDRWPSCEVDGCFTRVLPGWKRCHEHGGDTPAEAPYDPEGGTGITLTDPAAFAWEQTD